MSLDTGWPDLRPGRNTFSVTEYFIFQPYSNITDWSNPPYMTNDFTGFGAALYAEQPGSPSGTSFPWATFSPNIYSQIRVHAQNTIRSPATGITLRTNTMLFDGYVTSPGYIPPTDVCTGTFTFQSTSITDPIDPIIDAVKNCGPWLECVFF